ncbi:tyrosine-type recombinase/integrase [Vibrio parahaemolyticus]|nr:tyrosine-type recombinase/integrase [Vibrio parahaemolyticus]EII2986380.1 tyrosine-type recombinase/integrase [Vibrio parahaemolyticus]EJG0710516.1 tyrosine-type recombinase/integrase [Vibrio parahaemolyticus]HAS6744445.1 tyrosine-type recombinase/integrase [Vibrio parahaemolyticus]HAS6746307.1 tyrosine-type recombinase/integrase [Vibrio parahaemolyticus]
MRYLSLNKSGIWQFRFQIKLEQRHLFDGRREIKRSLKTSDKQLATIKALELETKIRKCLLSEKASNSTNHHHILPQSISIQRTKLISGIVPLEALRRFCEYKRPHVSEKAVQMLEAKCKIVLGLVNKTYLKTIRRKDAEGAVSLLRQYPTNLKKHKQFEGLSGLEAIKLNEELCLPTLSEESVKDYCQKMSGFFEWCILNELTDINPFKAIRFKKQRKESEAKHAYTHSELKMLFATEIHTKRKFKHPHYFWLPLLGYCTGARLNELCQLYKSDIVQQDGIWLIRIDDQCEGQKLKNPSSRRIVPIHDKLIELGFINFLKSIQSDRLFPELKNTRDGFGSSASKWFGRFKIKLGFEKGHDFHSFRHTVATTFKREHVSHIVAGELLGHTQNNITYDRYGKNLEVYDLQRVINLIDTSVLSNIPLNRSV